MTSPASASFPWPQVPEPPSGEFRSGRLPAQSGGGGYIAARGSRPGPALLVLAGAASGFPALHGMFRLAGVLDAHRLAGSLLIRLAASGPVDVAGDLLGVADALLIAGDAPVDWQQLATIGYAASGQPQQDSRAARTVALAGAPYYFALRLPAAGDDPLAFMAGRGKFAARWMVPDRPGEREAAVEEVFQGTINMLRGLGMLEGQVAPVESRTLEPPAAAVAPVDGYWAPSARPGQRIRINDRLGSFRDAQGEELGDLLSNVSGILLGISTAVWVASGAPVAELARPLE